MDHYGFTPGFWKEFIIIMGAVVFVVGGIPAIIRRRIGADKKKWFSYNHINEFHKKADRTLRTIFVISVIASLIIFVDKPLIVLLLSIFFSVSQLGFQAYVEWRFMENRNNFKVSLVEIVLIFVTLIGILLWLE
ncbi:DUF4181 domain-containing protein [Virgibacillus necropolis]|uniref:DUF4181 domain-containing protein n=1 Tax=Virgibacillus necropolis TaxID=163877 RepID=A0A221MCQ3_9BACI|nr:DUF4181 domain-containing protein [Virgibacillus necropolis]ASN05414.1 hypothetical protein CFK40_10525 [Virgibacillus necropolis]